MTSPRSTEACIMDDVHSSRVIWISLRPRSAWWSSRSVLCYDVYLRRCRKQTSWWRHASLITNCMVLMRSTVKIDSAFKKRDTFREEMSEGMKIHVYWPIRDKDRCTRHSIPGRNKSSAFSRFSVYRFCQFFVRFFAHRYQRPFTSHFMSWIHVRYLACASILFILASFIRY